MFSINKPNCICKSYKWVSAIRIHRENQFSCIVAVQETSPAVDGGHSLKGPLNILGVTVDDTNISWLWHEKADRHHEWSVSSIYRGRFYLFIFIWRSHEKYPIAHPGKTKTDTSSIIVTVVLYVLLRYKWPRYIESL